MYTKLSHTLLLLSLLVFCASASTLHAEEPWQQWMSEAQFRELCLDLSRNVDLFKAVWKVDPEARFYGGTSRDFLWFVRNNLSKAKTKQELEKIVDGLKRRPIQVQEFVIGQSDVDVITDHTLHDVKFSVAHDPQFLTRIEPIRKSWFTPGTSENDQEMKQGGVPVEKIQLGKDYLGSHYPSPRGDGVGEIYHAKPTLNYDLRIRETDFFQRGWNHPILIALRYLRQVAITYYQLYGSEPPDETKLQALIDDASRASLEKILADVRSDPADFQTYLRNEKFTRRLNMLIEKVFRSYTNPSAARRLFQTFKVDATFAPYLKTYIIPYHTVMYKKVWNETDLARQRKQLQSAPAGYLKLAKDHFGTSDPFVYHGTPRIADYRSIILQGNIPSDRGLAGSGVYAVGPDKLEWAKKWKGGSLVAKLKLKPDATIVDITSPEGAKAFEEFKAKFSHLTYFWNGKEKDRPEYATETEFADFIGADIVIYDFSTEGFPAYVIKNGAAIRDQEGASGPLLTVKDVRAALERSNFDPFEFGKLVKGDPSIFESFEYLYSDAPAPAAQVGYLRGLEFVPAEDGAAAADALLTAGKWSNDLHFWNKVFSAFLGDLEPRLASLRLRPLIDWLKDLQRRGDSKTLAKAIHATIFAINNPRAASRIPYEGWHGSSAMTLAIVERLLPLATHKEDFERLEKVLGTIDTVEMREHYHILTGRYDELVKEINDRLATAKPAPRPVPAPKQEEPAPSPARLTRLAWCWQALKAIGNAFIGP